ncbi:UNVERIFIED_ORG: hemolysin activation/secretion protein [Shinella zoogloeoides]|nr:hemolysin activation/secretion protein [Shinella zoogloeoides]
MAFTAGAAFSQTASQITPQTFQPELQQRGRGFDLPDASGQAAPKGAEKLTVRLSGVVVEGGLPALASETAKVTSGLKGKTVTAADLFTAAGELQKAYAAAGYGLVRVVLPAQRVVDGATLKIVVIDGFLEKIDTSQLPEKMRSRIDALLAPLIGTKGITNAVIERRVLLAGDLPGTVLRSTLSQGKQTGGSVLTVEARYKPMITSASLDNRLSEELGRYSAGIGFDFNSILGLGEQFYLRASGAPRFGEDNGFFSDAPRNRMLAAGVTLPIGIDGMTLNLEGTVSRTVPEADPFGLVYQSDFTRYSARLAYPVIRSRDLNVNLTGAFDIQDETQTITNLGNLELSRDRLRVLRTGTDFSWYAPGGAMLYGGLIGSFGIDGLGARNRADAAAGDTPLSRQGADAGFQKLELNLGYRQALAEHLALDVKARAQTSFGQPMLNSEQIGLATTAGLSTYGSGRMQGDDGFVVRAEMQFPFVASFTLPFALSEFPPQQGTGLPSADATSGAVVISPYLFGAYGGVALHDPTALEQSWTRGAAYGLGLRLGSSAQASFTSTSLTLEYGRTERFGSGQDDNRFSLTANVQF